MMEFPDSAIYTARLLSTIAKLNIYTPPLYDYGWGYNDDYVPR